MSVPILCAISLAAAGLPSATLSADSLTAVENAIVAKSAKLNSWQAHHVRVLTPTFEGVPLSSVENADVYWMKSDDHWVSRKEINYTSTMGFGGPFESSQLAIDDGQYFYSIGSAAGHQAAGRFKSIDGGLPPMKAYLDLLKHMYDRLELLPDQVVDGKKCWVIEASGASTRPGAELVNMVSYFDQKSGLLVKNVGTDEDGNVRAKETWTDIRLNPQLSPDLFVPSLPPGLQFRDFTAQKAPAGSGIPRRRSVPEAPHSQHDEATR